MCWPTRRSAGCGRRCRCAASVTGSTSSRSPRWRATSPGRLRVQVQSLAIGGVFLAKMLPAVLLGPLAGAFADRFDRRLTMVAADLARFAVVLSIPLVGSYQWMHHRDVPASSASTCSGCPPRTRPSPTWCRRSGSRQANQLNLLVTYGTRPDRRGAVRGAVGGRRACSATRCPRSRPGARRSLALYRQRARVPGLRGPDLHAEGHPQRTARSPPRRCSPDRRGLAVRRRQPAGARPDHRHARRVRRGRRGGRRRQDLRGARSAAATPAYGVVFGAVFVGMALGMFFGLRLLRELSPAPAVRAGDHLARAWCWPRSR